jgi:hypothetical protein
MKGITHWIFNGYLLFSKLPGFGLLFFQLFVYPVVERIFGPIMVSRIGAVCLLTKFLLYIIDFFLFT